MKKWFIVIFLFLQVISLFSMDEWGNLSNIEGSIASEVKWKTAKELIGAGLGVLKPTFQTALKKLQEGEKGSKWGMIFSGAGLAGSGIYFVYRLTNYIKTYRALSKQFEKQRELLKKADEELKKGIKKTLPDIPSSSAGPQNKNLITGEYIKGIFKQLLKSDQTDANETVKALLKNKDINDLKNRLKQERKKFLKIKEKFEKQKSFIKKVMPSIVLIFISGASLIRSNILGSIINTIQYLLSEGINRAK
jgi:hypothetical protein